MLLAFGPKPTPLPDSAPLYMRRDNAKLIAGWEAFARLSGRLTDPSGEALRQIREQQAINAQVVRRAEAAEARLTQAERERDALKHENESFDNPDRTVTHEYHLRVIEPLVAARKDAEARLTQTEEALRALREGLTEDRLYRVFWKRTINANLNTVPGCEQAARVMYEYVLSLEGFAAASSLVGERNE